MPTRSWCWIMARSSSAAVTPNCWRSGAITHRCGTSSAKPPPPARSSRKSRTIRTLRRAWPRLRRFNNDDIARAMPGHRRPPVQTNVNGLEDLDAVYFHALVTLACGVADALVGLDLLHARAPERTSMQIDVAVAAIRHHKAEALLVVEELDLAFDHGT